MCVGSIPVSRFRMLVESPKGGQAIPLGAINRLEPGDRLKYEPIHRRPEPKSKAMVAIILVPSQDQPDAEPKSKGAKQDDKSPDLEVLGAQPAGSPAEWDVKVRASAVGVVFGPHGLSVKKVNSLVEKNPQLLTELADYAQETSTVQALVETLEQRDNSPGSGGNLNAALAGFGSEYGLTLPKLDSTAPTDQQADLLLRAVLPSVSAYDPLNSGRTGTVEQSAGLAASVAGLFLGTPVGLAAGGAALVENLHTLVFPDTDFRAAFTLPAASGGLTLCAKSGVAKRTRIAYLWMMRVPNAPPPSVSLVDAAPLPLGAKSVVRVRCSTPLQSKLLGRARGWQLVPTTVTAPAVGKELSSSRPATQAAEQASQEKAKGSAEVPVEVQVESPEDLLSLDLTEAKLAPGEYRLAATWDWQPFEVAGPVDLRPFGDLSLARLTPDSEDRLIGGRGRVRITLTGADFEFVKKAALERAPGSADDDEGKPESLSFTLGKTAGDAGKSRLDTRIDTSRLTPGVYQIALEQSNGKTGDVPIAIHPPDPKLEGLPLRANLGQPQQVVILRGSGLERIDKITSNDAAWDLSPVPEGTHNLAERQATLKLLPAAKRGDLVLLEVTVEGLHKPIEIPGALRVAGPRPRVVSVRQSFSSKVNLELRPGELPAGSVVSFAIEAQDAGPHPSVELACSSAGEMRQPITLYPDDKSGGARLDVAGNGALFLSLDPAAVGQSGCQLIATVTDSATGPSDPYTLGRVVRLPRIEKFSLSDQKVGASLYTGVVTGWNLETIEKTGWDGQTGFPVQGIPTAVPGGSGEQTLEIALPWPPPAPRSPLYVWLRGDTAGRMADERY